jgi:hypothetical protein
MKRVLASGFVLVLAVACGSDSTGGFAGTGGSAGVAAGGAGNAAGAGGGVNIGGSNTGGGINLGGGAGTAGTGTGGGPLACVMGTKQCSGNIPQICGPNGNWISNPACAFVCAAGNCVGKCAPGTTQCMLKKTQTCDSSGQWGTKTDCEFGCDAATGGCKSACTAGTFNCYGNQIQQCDPGPPAKWVPKTPATVCAASSGQQCDAATGTCKTAPVIGGATATSEYYQYAIFKTGADYKGGYDVTSWGDHVYVNRSSSYLDVYKITLLDSDGDGKLEPNQHPSNPKHTGPIEQRTITYVKTYTKAAPDSAPTGSSSQSELLAMSNNDIYSLGPTKNGGIRLYDFNSKTTTTAHQPAATSPSMSFLGYAHDEKMFYGGNESGRRVYSYHEPTKAWALEFAYPNLAGSHMDGMDCVVSPKTGVQYIYVSDMTSDFIGQYRRDETQGWVQEQLFKYTDSTSSVVEGFGFGALNHFWATGGNILYELGGGDIQEDLEPCPNNLPACGAGNTCGGTDVCLDGCCYPNACPGGAQSCGSGQAACPPGQACQNGCCANQCPAGKQACGTGLPPCPGTKYCVAGCCSDSPQ